MITMGLINRLLRLLNKQPENQSTQQSSSDGTRTNIQNGDSLIDNWMSIEHDGRQFHCQVEESHNRQFQVAYADGQSGKGNPTHGGVFLLEEGKQKFAVRVERPNEVAVSNAGTVAVVDWEFGWGDGGLSGKFHIFDQTGTKLIGESFDSNLGPCAVTPDGRYAAVSTLNPDCSTYLFDVESSKLIAQHVNEDGNKQKLVFDETDSGWRLGLADTSRDEPAYAIDLSGKVVWRNEKDNLRGDVGELVKQLQQDDYNRTVTSDLGAIARQSPNEITPYLPALLDLVEEGVFETISNPGGDLNVSVESVFTSVAEVDPNEYDTHLNRLLANVREETSPAAAVISTSVLAELAEQELEGLVSKHGDVIDLLQNDSRDVRQRAVTIIEADAGRIYDQIPEIAERLSERLQAEDDLTVLRDITSALMTLLDERPGAAERMNSAVPRAVELLSVGDTDYQYGDVETYDYKDQTHYDTNHLHRTVPGLLAGLAPVYADQVTDAIPTLLNMLRQSGQRNTSLRSASRQALTSIVEHSRGTAQSVLETEFDQIVTLLDHEDDSVQVAAAELLVTLGTQDAHEELSARQDSKDKKLASAAVRGLRTLDSAIPLDPEVARLTPSGDDSIERQQRRYNIQYAYEFLQSEGTARKQMFIDEVYSEDLEGEEEQWWRVVRNGLKSIESVDLSGHTYSYTR